MPFSVPESFIIHIKMEKQQLQKLSLPSITLITITSSLIMAKKPVF